MEPLEPSPRLSTTHGMATEMTTVDVSPLQTQPPSGDLEGGDRKTEPSASSNVCVSSFRADRERVWDFYRHWPREYSGSNGFIRGWTLLIARVVFGLTSIGIFFWSIGDNGRRGTLPYWLIYLTNWILLTTAVHWILWCTVTFLAVKVPEDQRGIEVQPTWLVRISVWQSWSLATCLTVNFIVTLLFWALLFDPDTFIALRAFTHGGTFVVQLLDTFLSGHKLFSSHILFPFFFGVTYIIFTLIYWAAGGTDSEGEAIYDVLDWESEPGSAAVLFVVVALVVTPLSFCGCMGLSCLWRNQCRSCAP